MGKYLFEAEINMAATKYGLDPDLVAAFCFVESTFTPQASKFELKFKQKYIDRYPSYENLSLKIRTLLATDMGLMQVMGVVAHEFGLPLDKLENLFEPEVGLEYGCKKIQSLVKKYVQRPTSNVSTQPGTLDFSPGTLDVIAAYNQGDARKGAKGGYANQGYVDKVMDRYKKYRSKAQGAGLKAQD